MRLDTGQIISGVAHVGLIAFAIFGGAFQSEPLPFEFTEVTAVSEEQYAAMIAEPSPDAVANVDTPEPPEEGQAPQVTSEADAAPEQDQPEVAEVAEPDPVPEAVEPAPVPEAEVADEAPVLQPPQEDTAVLAPERSERPQPRPAPRVAPEAVAQPEPDVEIADVDQQASEPTEQAEEVQPEQEETAQEEATTEIVTEAEEVASAAPARSIRPQTRPERPTPAAQPAPEPSENTGQQAAPEPEPETRQAATPDRSAVNDALAEALGGDSQAQGDPQGPPLTAGEKDGLRVAVQRCWNVGALSSEALATTVTVAVSMSEDAKPVTSSIRMIGSEGGTQSSAQQAFEAARRAIIRCGATGYDLPVEKYATWRDIEMTFNPENMRIR